MISRTLTIAHLVFLLQGACQVRGTLPPDEFVINHGYDLSNNLPDVSQNNDVYMQEKTPDFPNFVTNPMNYVNLDDVYESQIPPPPTWKEPATTLEYDKTANNLEKYTSEDFTPTYKDQASGSLETNEIIIKKIPTEVPLSNSNINYVDNMVGMMKVPAVKKYHTLNFYKPSEMSLRNSQIPDEPPQAPQALSENFEKQSRIGNSIFEDEALNVLLQKHLILKLENEGQNMKKGQTQTEEQVTEKGRVEGVEEEETQIIRSGNAVVDDNIRLCDCQGGCDEGLENVSHNEGDSAINNPEDGNESNKNTFGLSTHAIFVTKKPNPENTANIHVHLQLPLIPSEEESEATYLPRENHPLSHIFFKLKSSKSKPTSTQTSSFSENGDVLQSIREQLNADVTDLGKTDEYHKDDQSSFQKFQSNSNDNGRIQSKEQASFVVNDPQFKILNPTMSKQIIPKEFILLKHLHEIMKAKAVENVLGNREEIQPANIFHFNESPNNSSPPISRLILMVPRNQRRPQLPPLYFPRKNSEFETKQLGNNEVYPKHGELKPDNLQSRLGLHLLTNMQDMGNSNDFIQRPTNDTPEEIPWFVRNMIAQLSRNDLAGNHIPVASQPVPQKESN